jgi:hypothetical protein
MDPDVARGIAHHRHARQRTRAGSLVTEHVERVAACAPDEARAVAFLHDVFERSPVAIPELVEQGLTPLELAALRLLTRAPGESYELHVLRIAHASGVAGSLARAVKLADLEDHLREAPAMPGTPPYGWARCHITFAQDRRGDAIAAPLVNRV